MTATHGKPRHDARHLVADIRFTPGDDAGSPMSCMCGWMGTVSEWNEHRGRIPEGRSKRLGPARDGTYLRRYPTQAVES